MATKRETSHTAHLDHLDIDWLEASLSDLDGLTRAFDRADWVFHCAAAVSVRYEVQPWIRAANVDGTANVVEAVRRASAGRLIHCSTVAALGISTDGEPCDETVRWNMPEHGLDDAYSLTKREAQELVLGESGDDLDAVVVNPTYMIGPLDQRPSSGELLLQVVNRSLPVAPPGVNNFVDVRDVARGMLGAAESGRTGEMYILGGRNMPYREFFALVSSVAGTPPITGSIPKWLAMTGAKLGDLYSTFSSREPLINSAIVEWGYTDGYLFTSSKAREELEYTISPLEPAIEAALDWFREHDML